MQESTGLATLIVQVIRKYGFVHIDLIAKELHRRPEEIVNSLRILEKERLLLRDGDMVRLAQEENPVIFNR